MENWEDIPNYEGLYEVSDLGKVKSLKRTISRSNGRDLHLPEKIMKQSVNKYGYCVINLCKDNISIKYSVHRLVLMSFKGISDNPINHINGVKTDNNLSNIEYTTPSKNLKHAYDVLKIKPSRLGVFGKENPCSKPIICINTQQYFDSIQIAAKKLNIHATNISAVCRNKIEHIKGLKFKYA